MADGSAPRRFTRLIYNPAAGRGRTGQTLPEIQAALKAAGIEPEIVPTGAPGGARPLARQAAHDGVELLLLAGGDGTLHETANGLVEALPNGALPTLGLIPIGTGNDFIKTLGVPSDWRAAVGVIARGQARPVDVGRVNGRVFVNTVGVGFDAQVGIEAQKIKGLKGQAVYLMALARALFLAYRTPSVVIQSDAETLTQRITMLTIGNGRCTGGGFWLTPDADPSDGLLDVCIVRGIGRPQIMALVPRVLKGQHTTSPAVQMKRGQRILITSPEPLPVHADGEILYLDAQRLEIEVLPGQIKMLV